jgi:serine protease Do
MRKFVAIGPALVVLMAVLVTLVAAPAAVRMIGYASTEASVRLAQQVLEEGTVLKQLDRAVRAIADSVEPSVVHIGVREESERSGRTTRRGQGSGWVYDGAGHIVTNAHVVRDATQVMVQFQDGRTVEAEIVGFDGRTDIAVLRVRTLEGLFPARRATSVELHQGERVYAFGSPFGFKFSMSEGIVSGLGRNPREIIGQDGFTNFIQTDAAVNPGNSGGPLVNVEGRVVGMNVAIATGSNADGISEGQSSGISFAIPLGTIENVVDQLIATGRVVRGFLGIQFAQSDDVNDRRVADAGYRGRGVFVTDVPSDGPAAAAGVRRGDVILRIAGQPTPSIAVLRSAITNNRPGDRVEVVLWREGEELTLTVILADLSQADSAGRVEAVQVVVAYGVADLGEDGSGVVLTEIREGSRAERDGVRAGDRLLAVNGQPVSNLADLFRVLQNSGLLNGRPATLSIRGEDGAVRDVTVAPRGR